MQKNRVELAGYLVTRPEIRTLPSGTKVANARLGESYTYQRKDGKAQTHTNWHSLSFYDWLADLAITFDKGDNLHIEGTIEQREFTPADGSKRTVHEIIVRSCHRIAPSRTSNGATQQPPAGEISEPPRQALEGVPAHDPKWPV